VHGDVVGRGVIDVSEELMYDVSDLANNPYLGLASSTYTTRALYGGRELPIPDVVQRRGF
jgi:hypothetical protein